MTPASASWQVAGEFELNVVGIAKDEHRAVRLIGDSPLCRRLGGRLTAFSAVGLEMDLPGFEVGASWQSEPHVVESVAVSQKTRRHWCRGGGAP